MIQSKTLKDFFTYLRGLVVVKLNEIDKTQNPEEIEKLLKHIVKFEAFEAELIGVIEFNQDLIHDNTELQTEAYKQGLEIKALMKERAALLNRLSEKL